MTGRVGNQRLHAAIQRYAKKNRVMYPEAIRRLASQVGYKDHTKIYSYVRGDLTPRGSNQHKIARELSKTVDHLFGGKV